MENRNLKLEAIKNWINDNKDIRAALITSSLVNPLAPIDDFSDLDIELVFEDSENYIQSKEWLFQFGDILNYYEEGIEGFDGKHAMRMVQYMDGVKVDFKIYSVEQFLAEVNSPILPEDWDIGYEILTDKDNLTSNLKPPTYQVSIIKKPSTEEFNKIVDDFWWDVTYIPKCLARGDLFYLKFMVEKIIRVEYLIPMIEWYVASQNHWDITTNKYGRLFKKYLSEQEWAQLEETFSGSDMIENKIACNKLLQVFNILAQKVATNLNYDYDQQKANSILNFVSTIHYK
ncbi:aminoglycoside 6-adenylyltransferase [Sphingobacterium endophyticum]|uniref:aminoglycoside 6-adenylyltransferase n=1 Tax=Sphingobacterium endophyticum TaxID=2546448 RepID=UPI0012E15811|nr:aminoglycoside 6-adenylyltransferase [Sphingobacterium endophyticum]